MSFLIQPHVYKVVAFCIHFCCDCFSDAESGLKLTAVGPVRESSVDTGHLHLHLHHHSTDLGRGLIKDQQKNKLLQSVCVCVCDSHTLFLLNPNILIKNKPPRSDCPSKAEFNLQIDAVWSLKVFMNTVV